MLSRQVVPALSAEPMNETALPLTPEEEAKVRELFARTADRDDPYLWRRWASDLTWIVPLYANRLIATLDAARESRAAVAKGTVIERGTVPCQTCRRPHDLRRLGDGDKAPVSWADPANGHLYVRMTAEQVVELSEAWTTERRPGDDAECERLGCEDRTRPVHHRVATALPPNCIAVDREYYETLRDCYMNQPAAPPVPATEPWQEAARRAMSCSCPVVVRLNHEPHRPPCPLAGETL